MIFVKDIFLNLTDTAKFFYNPIKPRDFTMRKIFALFIIVIGLAGCGQVYDREPVGVGYDNDELKLSPCACMMVYRG